MAENKREKELLKINPHINFKKEKNKSSARKTPTQVTCSKCKKIFTLPFKPRNPEIYCDECFKEKLKARGQSKNITNTYKPQRTTKFEGDNYGSKPKSATKGKNGF